MTSALLVLAVTFSQSGADRSAWDVLDHSLNDGSSARREQALAALSTIGEPNAEAVKRAENTLKNDKSVLVRQSAALALGELNAADSIPALKAALSDSPEVAFAAAKSLAKLGDQSGRDVLIAVLAGERKDAPGMMTTAERKAKAELHHPGDLMLMGAKDATGAMFGPVSMVFPATKDVIEMKGKGAPGRAAAAAYLARDPDPYAISLLEWALNDDEAIVRMEAAKALGERGNSGSLAKLQGLLNDTHMPVRDMAAAAMVRISDRNGEPGEVSVCTPSVPSKEKK